MIKNKPKILLGTPTFDGKAYCLDFWIKRVKEIQQDGKCDIIIIDNSKTEDYANLIRKKYKIKVIKGKHYNNQPLKSLGEARKLLFKYAIDNNYDLLLSIEQDIFPPKDILNHLLKVRQKIKSKRVILGTPYIITKITEEKSPYITKGYLTNIAITRVYSKVLKRKIQKNITLKQVRKRKNLFKAYACGLGCTLIDTEILKKVNLKYTEDRSRPDDAFFYLDCYNKKIPVYVDPSLTEKIIHIDGSVHSLLSWGKQRNVI